MPQNSAQTGFKSIAVIGQPEGLAISLIEQLLINKFRVDIVSGNISDWKTKLSHIKNIRDLRFLSLLSWAENTYDLCFLIDPAITDKADFEDETIPSMEKYAKDNIGAKFIFIHHWQNSALEKKISFSGLRIKTISVGHFFGPRMNLNRFDPIASVFLGLCESKQILLPKTEVLVYPLAIEDLSRKIIETLETFNEDKEIYFGPKNTIVGFALSIIKNRDGYSLAYDNRIARVPAPYGLNRITIKSDLNFWIEKTIHWFENNPADLNKTPLIKETKLINPVEVKKQKIKKPGIKLNINFRQIKLSVIKTIKTLVLPAAFLAGRIRKIKNNKFLKLTVNWIVKKIVFHPRIALVLKMMSVSVLLAAIPFLLFGGCIGSLYFAQKLVFDDRPAPANLLFRSSRLLGNTSLAVFSVLELVPGNRQPFANMTFLVKDTVKVGEIGSDISGSYKDLNDLVTGIIGNRDYPLTALTKKLSLDADILYRQASFFEGEAKSRYVNGFIFTKNLLDFYDFKTKKEQLLLFQNILNRLPSILGAEGEKNYLLIFQNNMELRPTGGFIGSFAIVKTKEGRLADFKVYDVYDADGQLRGHVEPPLPIKNYLGEANWYLRDANWDPDFEVSAEKIKWFLNKELDINVDGVISVDVEVLKDILKALGPIKINDYGKIVNDSNIYEITQYEVEEKFFPGSKKKSSFLTALAKEVLMQISQAKGQALLSMVRYFYQNLEEGHIQIALNDPQTKLLLGKLNWSGNIGTQPCPNENCFYDWAGLVEANVGVNKANYFIRRSISVDVSLEPELVSHNLTVLLTNNANPVLGSSAVYKAYVRLVAPEGGKIEKVGIGRGEIYDPVNYDLEYRNGRLEAGIIIEVKPGMTKKISYTWSTSNRFDFNANGEYRFLLEKQSGTDRFRTDLNVNYPKNIRIIPEKTPSLTAPGTFGYNLNLSDDYLTGVRW